MWKTALALLLCVPLPLPAFDESADSPVVEVRVESSLPTDDRQIRQYAFDGDPETSFVSARNAAAEDHFTLRFDRPVRVKSVAVTSGRPDGSATLNAAKLQGSADGDEFLDLTTLDGAGAPAAVDSRELRAVRIISAVDRDHPLILREIAIESDPPLQTFQYPVEIAVNVDDAPEMREWAENTARICERAYPLINEELTSDGFRPPPLITMTLRSRYRGVAATSGTRITGSVRFFTEHPDDVGAMVHEVTHVVQRYQSGDRPGWLVEGIADYVRFFKFEPGNLGRINPETARYDGSYRVSAAFLAYLVEQYDADIVRKLNEKLRAGEYTPDLWREFTGKPVEELGDEWQATLQDRS
jgi:hypothetical protein